MLTIWQACDAPGNYWQGVALLARVNRSWLTTMPLDAPVPTQEKIHCRLFFRNYYPVVTNA